MQSVGVFTRPMGSVLPCRIYGQPLVVYKHTPLIDEAQLLQLGTRFEHHL